jgi:hypothetical protein
MILDMGPKVIQVYGRIDIMVSQDSTTPSLDYSQLIGILDKQLLTSYRTISRTRKNTTH